MQKTRISKSAITSLVAGMLFFIPLITGLIGLVFGIISLRAISKNNGLLIGKRVALAGVILGSLSLLAWSFILFGNAVYTIQHNEEAIVFRGNDQKHITAPGVHFITPGIERVKVYDLSKVYSDATGTQSYILINRELAKLDVSFNWRICEPEEHADNFLSLDTKISGEAIRREIIDAIRTVLFTEKVIDLNDMKTEKIFNAISKRVEDRVKAYGMCLAKDANSDKSLRFAIMVN